MAALLCAEPFSMFFDFFALGDGEELLVSWLPQLLPALSSSGGAAMKCSGGGSGDDAVGTGWSPLTPASV
jgi:hypothetical protein